MISRVKTAKGGARKSLLFLGTAFSIVAIDQATKFWAEANLTNQSVQVIGDLLRFRLAYNDAAAFSLGSGQLGF